MHFNVDTCVSSTAAAVDRQAGVSTGDPDLKFNFEGIEKMVAEET